MNSCYISLTRAKRNRGNSKRNSLESEATPNHITVSRDTTCPRVVVVLMRGRLEISIHENLHLAFIAIQFFENHASFNIPKSTLYDHKR